MKLCIDCRHAVNTCAELARSRLYDWICMHPSATLPALPPNPVTGEIEPSKQITCEEARGYGGVARCRPKGRYWEEKDIGFGNPGWAEAVATPDDEVGYVFTPLGPEFTGLPVDVWVGDDAPLVIAGAQLLEHQAIAAVRRWAVAYRDALTAHWRGEIDSIEMIDRLREGKGNG